MKNVDSKSSGNERIKTDQSLDEERVKTDSYLDEKSKRVESDSDEVIRASRQATDEGLKRTRQEADQQSHSSSKKENADFNEGVERERLNSDKAQETARIKEDRIRSRERFEKNLIAEALLTSEREGTDSSLLSERIATDQNLVRESEDLKNERVAHAETRASLLTRDQYLAIVSHDLRNPIGAITMSVEVARSSLEKNDVNSADLLKVLAIIERNALSMDRMIHSLLDVERMENGKFFIEKKPTKIKALISDTEKLFKPIIAKKNIHLETDVADSELSATFDCDRMSQVLSNLIGNAVKYAPPKSVITIGANAKNRLLEFYVSDQGPGIDKQNYENIFNRFSQLKAKDRSGLGLGLFIARKIVEAHSGTLSVESIKGEGTTFRAQIPFN